MFILLSLWLGNCLSSPGSCTEYGLSADSHTKPTDLSRVFDRLQAATIHKFHNRAIYYYYFNPR